MYACSTQQQHALIPGVHSWHYDRAVFLFFSSPRRSGARAMYQNPSPVCTCHLLPDSICGWRWIIVWLVFKKIKILNGDSFFWAKACPRRLSV